MRYIRYKREKQQINFLNCNSLNKWEETCIYRPTQFYDICDGCCTDGKVEPDSYWLTSGEVACGSVLGGDFNPTYQYTKDYKYNRYTNEIIGYEWRNGTPSCECGYNDYVWKYADRTICGYELGEGYDPTSKYQVWEEVNLCNPNDVRAYQYKTPVRDCECGYVAYEYRISDPIEYECSGTTQMEKWYKWSYCPNDSSFDENTGEYELRHYMDNSCECGYKEYEWIQNGTICGSQLGDGYDPTYNYDVWEKWEKCSNAIEEIEYRNGTPSCECGYKEYEWIQNGTICGYELGDGYDETYIYEVWEKWEKCSNAIEEIEYRNGTYSVGCDRSVVLVEYYYSGTSSYLTLNRSDYDVTTNDGYVNVNVIDLLDGETWTEAKSLFTGSNITELVQISNTSNITNMQSMFWNCSRLTSLDVSGWDTRNVINMKLMFYGCSGLTSLDLSSFDTSNVTNMSDMFSYCTNLTSLDVSGWDTRNVTNMDYMFYNCSGLTSLDLSSFDTSAVTSFNQMFYGCSGLTSLDLSGWNIRSNIAMVEMFNFCPNLTTIYMRGCNADTIAKIEEALTDCGIRDNVTIITSDEPTNPDTGDTPSTRNDVLAFEFTGGSGTYLINSKRYTATTSPYSTTLEDLGVTTWYDAYWLFIETPVTRVISIPDTSNVTNMYRMFYNCTSLTSLNVSSFDTSNVTNMSVMFGNCKSLISLDVSNFDTSNVTDMSAMFQNCTGLTYLDLSNFNTSNVTSMEWMFWGCDNLSSLDLSGWNMGNVTTTEIMFLYCSALRNIYMRGCNADTIAKIEEALTYCEIRDNVTIIT